jgi:LmbE family N-acetylglucosaminyl deacetylase
MRFSRPAAAALVAGVAAGALPLMSHATIPAADDAPMAAGAILQALHNFRQLGSVLYVAAHPDDEDTQLIAWLARGRGARTAYLSLTRGDGGQNLIGAELGEALGVLRTQELLAARRIDRAEQFFTRARDFGFSKDYSETLAIWDHRQVLADTVRVIRTFRPDVIITAFSTTPGGTHGHHTASAMLTVEAFGLAGDPDAFPGQLDELEVWQPTRVLHGVRFRRGGAEPSLQVDIGGYNTLLGQSYGEISARSRSMHSTQGFGAISSRGATTRSFAMLAGEPATRDILDDVATDWGRISDGGEIDALAAAVEQAFDPRDPSASVPALLEIRRRLNHLQASQPNQALLQYKRAQLDQILRGCLGLYLETTVTAAEVVPGEALSLTHTAIARGKVPVRWVGVRHLLTDAEVAAGIDLPFNQPESLSASAVLPADTPLSQPYWLRQPGTTGMFVTDDPAWGIQPDNAPVFAVEQIFEVGGERLVFADEPVEVIRDPARGELRHRLRAIAPAALGFADSVELFAPGATREIVLEVRAARPGVAGALRLETPAGWTVAPAARRFELANPQDTAKLNFSVTAPARSGVADFGAVATVGAAQYHSRRIDLRYAHLPGQLLQPPARLRALSLELSIRGRSVGYLPGAGDEVAEGIERLGYAVTRLTGADMTAQRLREFDAVVLGVRAFNTREDLPGQLPALMDYVENGGTLLVQYNTQNNLLADLNAAMGVAISRDRVTDENARVRLLAPDHPALAEPNRIGAADFDGWVQERGLYFPNRWDEGFTPLLACHDAGESEKSGALLVARRGQGHVVYASLSFFRQLPEGVPGAYRLLANLLSLGQ